MNDSHDEAIDQALAALHAAEAPEGMEARILRRLDAAAAPRPRALGWWYAGGLTALAAILLTMAVREFHPISAPATVSSVQPKPAAHTSGSASVPASEAASPRRTAPAVAQTSPGRPALQPLRSAFPRRTPNASDQTRQARATLLSFPAPAEPLTEQEKLLQRVARRGDQEDFDLLNPESVELAMALDKADFDEFLLTVHRK